jgi:hypothetical protein
MKVILSCSFCLGLSMAAVAASDPTKPELAIAVPVSTAAPEHAVMQNSKFKLGLVKNVRGHFMALINGQAVKEGEQIDGYTVVEINRQQVVLQRANERLTLSLFKAMKTQ